MLRRGPPDAVDSRRRLRPRAQPTVESATPVRHRGALAECSPPRLRSASRRPCEIPRRVPVLQPSTPRLMGCTTHFPSPPPPPGPPGFLLLALSASPPPACPPLPPAPWPPGLHASGNYGLPAVRYPNVLNHYRLFAACSNLLKCEKPCLVCIHHARRRVGEPGHFHGWQSRISSVRQQLHCHMVRRRHLMAEHLFQGVSGPPRFRRIHCRFQHSGIRRRFHSLVGGIHTDHVRFSRSVGKYLPRHFRFSGIEVDYFAGPRNEFAGWLQHCVRHRFGPFHFHAVQDHVHRAPLWFHVRVPRRLLKRPNRLAAPLARFVLHRKVPFAAR